MTLQDKLDNLPPQARRGLVQKYIDKATKEEADIEFRKELLAKYKSDMITERDKQP